MLFGKGGINLARGCPPTRELSVPPPPTLLTCVSARGFCSTGLFDLHALGSPWPRLHQPCPGSVITSIAHSGFSHMYTVGSDSTASASNAGDLGLIPGSGRSSGEGNGTPLQCSRLENPMDGGAWRATVRGVAKSRTRLSGFSLPFTVCRFL